MIIIFVSCVIFIRSEHERHSPVCPFVRGEHTHNVPLTISHATAPAFVLKKVKTKKLGSPIIAKSSLLTGAAVAYTEGLVVVLDIAQHAKVLTISRLIVFFQHLYMNSTDYIMYLCVDI